MLFEVLRNAFRRDRPLRVVEGPSRYAESVEQDSDGAFVHVARIRIAATSDLVWRLLDPAGDSHRWGLRGDRIDPVDRTRGLFRLTDRRMPDEPFLMQVDERSAFSLIAATLYGDGGRPIGAVSKSSSRYEIVADASGGCAVTLSEKTKFLDGLAARDLRRHARMMSEGVATDLRRLKEEAESLGAAG